MDYRTPLYNEHLAMGAKLVDFAGWEMPIHYGSQIEEHHQVRKDAGMFDVSHMTIVDLDGQQTRGLLRVLLANNIDKLKKTGQALYTCMLNEQGGIIDDLIVYFMDEQWFRIVVNAATRDKDLRWIARQAMPFGVEVSERPELALIAAQGPNARVKVCAALGDAVHAADALAPFQAMSLGELFIARTGYTGEDGFEIMLPGIQASAVWQALYGAGVKPIGLGARDTLRLEAGMNLYGTDMDEAITPLESGLAWTVGWEPSTRRFVGREALERKKMQGVQHKLVGLVLGDKGVLRNHQRVFTDGLAPGEITSGSFSPTLGKAIAFARLPVEACGTVQVEIRSKRVPASIVKPPFVKHGKSCVPPELAV